MRSFDYSDSLGTRKNIRNTGYFAKEKELALRFVNSHSCQDLSDSCPICGCKRVKYLFQRWDVNYYICDECFTIFVPVDNSIMNEYLDMPAMNELRKSDEYQKDACERRTEIWEDMDRWLRYRTFRYIGKKGGLFIVDYADRYKGQVNIIKNSKLCDKYMLTNSILEESEVWNKQDKADILLYLNQLQHEINPRAALNKINSMIKKDGLLVLSTRLGSGFDILTLKGSLDNIYPYEHVMLPSRNALEILLKESGFELLEFLTPGALDVKYVLDNVERVDDSNLFVKELLKTDDVNILKEFQRLLQKAGLSSFAQIVAKKITD